MKIRSVIFITHEVQSRRQGIFSALGTQNDNFTRCPPPALDWRFRRFRMLEEIARHDPDVVCLQEVDHFQFLQVHILYFHAGGNIKVRLIRVLT